MLLKHREGFRPRQKQVRRDQGVVHHRHRQIRSGEVPFTYTTCWNFLKCTWRTNSNSATKQDCCNKGTDSPSPLPLRKKTHTTSTRCSRGSSRPSSAVCSSPLVSPPLVLPQPVITHLARSGPLLRAFLTSNLEHPYHKASKLFLFCGLRFKDRRQFFDRAPNKQEDRHCFPSPRPHLKISENEQRRLFRTSQLKVHNLKRRALLVQDDELFGEERFAEV